MNEGELFNSLDAKLNYHSYGVMKDIIYNYNHNNHI